MSVGSPTAGTWSSSQWRPDNEFETDRIERWRRHYTEERPHMSLGDLTPAEFKGQYRDDPQVVK